MKHKQGVARPFKLSITNQLDNAFLYQLFQKKIEKRIREYPSVAPLKIDNQQSLWYKERESPIIHVEQVSKKLDEHG